MTQVRDPNLHDPGDAREIPGYRVTRRRVGQEAGAQRLGASTWTLPPGQAAYPYHFHHVDEELLVVLQGRPLLRAAGGWRRLEEGAVVACPAGEAGGHQLVNDGDGTVRFLSVSTNAGAEVVVYPDLDQAGVLAAWSPDGVQSILPLAAAQTFDPSAFPPPTWPDDVG